MVKIIFLLLANLLFADIVDVYRYKGIDEVKKILESKLQSKEYWLKKLKDKNVKYGYYENNSFILLCNKAKRKLKVYKYENGKADKLFEFNNIIVGKLGQKVKEGDLKTPIGVYSLVSKIKPSDSFYGPLAFVTSYPNLYDKLNNRNGHGIWIHGKPLNGKRADLSKGCIVLDNDKLLKLANTINYQFTTLQIYQTPIFAKKEEIASILAMLYKWRDAWQKSDFNRYISFYDKDFKRSNKDNLKKFVEYKKRVFKIRKHQKIKIFFKNITIVPYQNFQNIIIYRIAFDEEYFAPNYTFKGKKEIFVRKRNNKFKIFIEK